MEWRIRGGRGVVEGTMSHDVQRWQRDRNGSGSVGSGGGVIVGDDFGYGGI